jgi:hypothetical protein
MGICCNTLAAQQCVVNFGTYIKQALCTLDCFGPSVALFQLGFLQVGRDQILWRMQDKDVLLSFYPYLANPFNYNCTGDPHEKGRVPYSPGTPVWG